MSQIILEFDNILEKSKIEMPLLSSSKSEGGENYNDSGLTDKAQTAVFGIQVPLILINNTIIDFDAVNYFELKSAGRIPELVLSVEDRYELINNIDKPGSDNEVRIQIIPKFDNTYKKIDMTFFISNIKVNGSILRISCNYKLPSLTSSNYESYGELDTYSIFKEAAKYTKLGFATNIGVCNDKRFVYADNKSWFELMNEEIQFSNTTDHILDYWIDFWDNLNIVDIKERYTTIDSDDDIMIWVSGQTNEVTVDTELTPLQVPAVITNHPFTSNSELFVKRYEIINSPGVNVTKGSDKVYGIYEENKKEYLDHLLQDGDIKKDIFTRYEYIGESYGEYNYLLSKVVREGFIQKMNSEKIQVTLKSPLLGLMRGHKVNFIRYLNDDKVESKMKYLEENNIIDRNTESNIPLNEYEMKTQGNDGNFRIDKTVSAQYLINSVNIVYTNNEWDYTLTLVRPACEKPNIIND